MRINQNIPAMSAYRALSTNQNALATSTERLASGLRINRAADDAAGLAISETMRAQVNGLGQAQRNTLDGISLLQTAEGGLNETHALLQRMRTLAVQAANGVNGKESLSAIQTEMTQLTADIDRIATTTQFNGAPLLDGTFRKKNPQVGANAGDTQQVDIMSTLQPATPGRQAGVALWDVYQSDNLKNLGSQVTVEQTVGGTTTKENVTMPVPRPESVTDLAAALNYDSSFNGTFTASVGYHRLADGTTVGDANLIITANMEGAGVITVNGIASNEARKQSDTGEDSRPEHPGGFGSADLLGSPIDVTSAGGSGSYTSSGPSLGFGVADDVGSSSTVTVSWGSGASQAISAIDRAIAIVSKGRADIGAMQNGLEHTTRSLGVSAENLTLAESRIRDTDMAKEVAEMQKRQIMSQATTAMLAQANQIPQTVLKLLG